MRQQVPINMKTNEGGLRNQDKKSVVNWPLHLPLLLYFFSECYRRASYSCQNNFLHYTLNIISQIVLLILPQVSFNINDVEPLWYKLYSKKN